MFNFEEGIEINLKDLFRFLKKYLWIVLLCGMITGTAAFSISHFLITPQYQSGTKVYILSKNEDNTVTYNDMQLGAQLTKDYAQLIKNRDVLTEVIENCELEESYESLAENISIENISDTRIISIKVKDEDPERAQIIAEEICEVASNHIKEVMDIQAVNIAEKANLPKTPVSPNKMKWALWGTIVGLLSSIILIIGKFLKDDSIKSSEDITKYIGLSTLATIPFIKGEFVQKNRRRQNTYGKENGNRMDQDPEHISPHIELKHRKLDFREREAFKMLRTKIDFSGENIKTICLTSSIPNEGKSSISLELAKSYSLLGEKVLLIDADLRKPGMNGLYEKKRITIGLVNYLAGKVTLVKSLYRTDMENLWLIPAGPAAPNPTELLGSTRFKEMMDVLKKNFDRIIIDTPPLGAVIDSVVVAKKCDGAVIVIGARDVSRRYARSVAEQLKLSECKILGCVLNRVNLDEIYGKNYGKYYGKYYGVDFQNFLNLTTCVNRM